MSHSFPFTLVSLGWNTQCSNVTIMYRHIIMPRGIVTTVYRPLLRIHIVQVCHIIPLLSFWSTNLPFWMLPIMEILLVYDLSKENWPGSSILGLPGFKTNLGCGPPLLGDLLINLGLMNQHGYQHEPWYTCPRYCQGSYRA